MLKKIKKPLYIFVHIFKCAGTTLREHVLGNFKKDEVLILYKDEKPMFKKTGKNIKKYIESLTQEQRDKIKIIFGHEVHYIIPKLFPNREVRCITFFRDPVDRIISHYNFRRYRLRIETKNKRLRKQFIRNKKILNFREWFLFNDKLSRNLMVNFLFGHFFDEAIIDETTDKKKLKKIKKILDKFYFVGITENPEDFLFIYHKLGIDKFFPNANISKKYFTPKDYEKTKKFILSTNKYDQKLYEYALKLNEKFKKKHLNFWIIIIYMRLKKFFGHLRLPRIYHYTSSKLVRLYWNILPRLRKTYWNILPRLRKFYRQISPLGLIYKLSAKLKKRFALYSKFIHIIKNGR